MGNTLVYAERDLKYDPPLPRALESGRLNLALSLIKNDVNVNSHKFDSDSPLQIAVRKGQIDVTSAIISKGADINQRDKNNYMLIHMAAHHNYIDICRILLDNEAQIDARDDDHFTPLHIAINKKYLNLAEFLIERGSDLKPKDIEGNTSLHLASIKTNVSFIKFLIKYGSEVNSLNKYNKNPLYYAFLHKKLDIALVLIRNGSIINDYYVETKSILEIAIQCDKIELCSEILDRNMNLLNICNDDHKNKKSPLQIAFDALHFDICVLLITRGADLSVVKIESPSSYSSSSSSSLPPLPSFFLNFTPLHLAANYNHIPLCNILISHNFNPNAVAYDMYTPLYLAVSNGYTDLTKLLIDHGAKINDRVYVKQPLLHMSIEKEFFDITNILIDHGSVKTQKNYFRDSPLHYAACKGNEPLVLTLLEPGGCPVDISGNNDDTPLFIAIDNGFISIASLLIQKGANVYYKDKYKNFAKPLKVKSNRDKLTILVEKSISVTAGANATFTKQYALGAGQSDADSSVLSQHASHISNYPTPTPTPTPTLTLPLPLTSTDLSIISNKTPDPPSEIPLSPININSRISSLCQSLKDSSSKSDLNLSYLSVVRTLNFLYRSDVVGKFFILKSLGDSQACSYVCMILSTHIFSPSVVGCSLEILLVLSAASENLDRFTNVNLIGLIFYILELYANTPIFIILSTRLLTALSSHKILNQQCRDFNTYPLLIKIVLPCYNLNFTILDEILTASIQILNNHKNVTYFIQFGFANILIVLLENHYHDTHLTNLILDCLLVLCQSGNNLNCLNEIKVENVVKKVLSHWQSLDPNSVVINKIIAIDGRVFMSSNGCFQTNRSSLKWRCFYFK